MDYQDLNFKFNLPTKHAGTFSVWGTSLIDKFKSTYEEDVSKWEHTDDGSVSKSTQYMVAGGITHRYFFSDDAMLKTTLATTYSEQQAASDTYDKQLNSVPTLDFGTRYTNLILTSSFNRKVSSRFTNKTGFTLTRMFYRMDLFTAPYLGKPLNLISEGDGSTNLISVYNSSSIGLSDKLTMNAGLYGQLLTLNNQWTLEPRVGLKWQPRVRTSLAASYGMYSRMEKMDVYFIKAGADGNQPVNRNLDFTKAHHLMLSFAYLLSDNMNLKVEPYIQFLYDVPVVKDGSFSVLNRSDFYVEDALVSEGRGRNVGVDITLERYLSKGFYYMITASLFDSRYRGGDGVWHDTRFNRRFVLNGLIGKEWMMGRNKQNVLSLNLKLTLQGGDRYAPIDYEATIAHPDKEVQYDETRAFSIQRSPMLIGNYAASFRMNKKRISHEFAVKGLNFTKAKEYYGHNYNLNTGAIDDAEQATSLINVSYKLDF